MTRTSSLGRRGFTLIELLLVIGIIAILASIVIIAINPTKQLGQARDAQRRSDVNTILNAVYQYSIDNNGNLPGNLGTIAVDTDLNICQRGGTSGVDAVACAAISGVSLSALTGSYLVSIPNDPSLTAATATGLTRYTIRRDANGRITVKAPRAEQTTAISVTR